MPQITKVRIVNFQYNDGNRLIADELYDFERENKGPSDVLIHLANGGGKSVLVQLMMQPMIPKAKVGGRRIESFFTRATDHCYVAIEWSLDGSKTKLMTGIAMAASDSASDTDSDRGFQIKYYTFISSYQHPQDNYSITSLPLSQKENGKFLPASFDDIRNLAKKSSGKLERYASDDSIKWQEKLSQYGIIQNEWRMIEELNSNEDGLSKYFSNLNTSDAVIDKLMIPRIEEKQNYAISKDDSSLETMLISYAKQFSKQQDMIREREVCSGFYDMLKMMKDGADELWRSNDSLEKWIEKLFAYADALDAEITRQKETSKKLTEETTQLREKIRHIQWEKISSEFYTCREAFERESANLRTVEATKAEAKKRWEEAKRTLLLMECANYYEQLKQLEYQVKAISNEITRREHNAVSAEQLASLKYSAYLAINEKLQCIAPEIKKLSEDKETLDASISELAKELTSLQKEIDGAKTTADKAIAVLDKQMQDNDASVEELCIGIFRMLDQKYQTDELNEWQKTVQKKEQDIREAITATANEEQALETRKEAIPQKKADAQKQANALKTELDAICEKLSAYHDKERQLKLVLEKNGLNFQLRFSDNATHYLAEQVSSVSASISDEIRKIEATETAISSVKRGLLHIPKMLSDYLDSTGIRYCSVETYLLAQQAKGSLSKEACIQFLTQYPFTAYGVIVEASQIATIFSEVEGRWLPAILPIFTAEDIETMLRGEGTSFSALSAYSKDYFLDSNSYAIGLQEALHRQYARKKQLEDRKVALQEDLAVVEAFSVYDADWETRMLSDKEKWERSITAQLEIVTQLQQELTEIKENIRKAREKENCLNADLHCVHNQLAEFDKLRKGLEEENSLFIRLEIAETTLRELTDKQRKKTLQKATQEAMLSEILDRLNGLEAVGKSLQEGLDRVSDATEADVIHGEWNALLAEYEALLAVQNADLKRLHDEKNRFLKEVNKKQKEIEKRACHPSEYEDLIYSEELERKAVSQRESAEMAYQTADAEFLEANRSQSKAESSFENVTKQLQDFGGEALPMNEVGKAFDERISDIKKKLAEIATNSQSVATKLSQLQRIQGKTDSELQRYSCPVKYHSMILEEDYVLQLDSITRQIREWEGSVATSKQKVEHDLKKMASDYGTGSANVTPAITSMQELLSNAMMQGDRYYTLCEHIEANMHTVNLRISQIDTDLKEFHKTKGDLIRQCVIQGRQMYEGLLQLSNRSKVKVQDKRRQMLKFDIPEAVDENIAHTAITAEIDKGTEEIVAKMAEETYSESDIRRLASRTVGSKRLLRKYIGSETIVLKAYKIDRNPEHSGYRTWEQTQINNSGAEKFVVYFAVILALMAYTRDEYDAIDTKNNRSVLILDNPFGPISSKHVLEPMFEISRNYHVQMICLSDISKSDIVSCFDLVIRAIVKSFALSNKEQLTHQGNESIEHGFYRSEQLNLF